MSYSADNNPSIKRFNESKATSRATGQDFLRLDGFIGPLQGGAHFRYPANLPSPPIDKWILFEARNGRHVLRDTIVTETNQTDRTLASVGLYLDPSALVNEIKTEWTQTELGWVAEAAAQMGKSFADVIINPSLQGFTDIVGAIGGKLKGVTDSFAPKAGSTGFLNDVVNNIKTLGEGAGALAGVVAQGGLADVFGSLDDVLRQPKGTFASITGVSPNPRSDRLFGHVMFREHDMNFMLIPRDVNEAIAIDNIIHFFQFYMLPKYGKTSTVVGATIGNFLIGFPYEFEVSMFDGNANELLHINRIGRSVLTDCKINHAAGSKTAFIKANNEYYPVATKLDLHFLEVKLLARDSSEINRQGADQNTLDEGSRTL